MKLKINRTQYKNKHGPPEIPEDLEPDEPECDEYYQHEFDELCDKELYHE